MAEGVVESKEEMKKKMEEKKKQAAAKEKLDNVKKDTEQKIDSAKVKINTTKDETKQKLTSAKEDTKEKLTTAKEDTKEKVTDAKETAEEKIDSAKEDTKDTWGNVQDNLGDFRDEAASKFEQYRKESEKEGRNPAEKFLSDIFAGMRQKTEEANQAMKERTGPLPTILPLTDVIESEKSITIISDIPGLTKENIDIDVSQNSVEITAKYGKEPESSDSKFIQKERGYGKVQRVIELPSLINIDKTTASYKDNTLTITLPKKERDVTKITIGE